MFKNMKLRTKIIMALCTVTVIALVTGLAGFGGSSLIGAVIFALAFSFFVGFLLVRDIVGTHNSLILESRQLAEALINGKLDTRGDVRRVSPEFRRIIENMNNAVGTLVGYIHSIPTPVLIIDRSFTIQYINQAGADLLGIPQQQLIGQKCRRWQ